MVDPQYLAVHCHYYQPPRGNPFVDQPLVEEDAAPYKNWNERITAECYAPNAAINNFKSISFNLGETLAAWLDVNAPETYQKIVEAVGEHLERFSVGNAIAQGMHHTILPLSRYEDKVTQVAWGLAVFKHRFKHKPQGMWLPEMAVDEEVLCVLVDHGIEWTILSAGQVIDPPPGSGPFWVNLPGGRRIKIFVRDDHLSNDIAFNLGYFGGAGRWAREVLVPRKRDAGVLTLIATDGETFGHHWRGEEHFLHWLLTYEAHAAGYDVISLNRYAQQVQPQHTVAIREFSSWSCGHGLSRWATGCDCTPGDSTWKAALRRAMENLRFEVDAAFLDFVEPIDDVDPYALRNAYIDVVLGLIKQEEFLKHFGVSLKEEKAEALLKLVIAQFHRQRMFSSCTYFFPELNGHATVYGIANAAYCIKLTREALGIDLAESFRRDLMIARQYDVKTGKLIVGGDLFDEVVEQLEV
nr:DUF3536 domain-containing protein [Anaerolineae bacterium]